MDTTGVPDFSNTGRAAARLRGAMLDDGRRALGVDELLS
jgi:hypothetical protein